MRKYRFLPLRLLFFSLLVLLLGLTGCGGDKGEEKKVKDLEFTVASPGEIPAELTQIIEQKKKDSFRLTYTNDQNLFIAAGYGEQKTGGYSITVPELYLTENSIIIKTELIGPDKQSQECLEPSWPFIVVKTELLEKPVIFR